MNEVRISGVIKDLAEQNSPTGTFLVGRLRFRKEDDVLFLVAGADKLRAFGQFDSGDAVVICGHLEVSNGQLVIMLDEVSPWKIAARKPNSMFMRDRDVEATRHSDANRGKRQSWR